MATIKELAQKRSDIFYVDPRVLKVKPGWNARNGDDPENREHILSLARSIAEVGVQVPLTVYREKDGEFYISDGHCRYAATLYALDTLNVPIKTVPVTTEGAKANEADYVFSQVLRNSGKPLSTYEAGTVYKRLVAYGWDVADIAKRSGRSVSAINAALDLQGAPAQIQKLVASGKVSATLATETVKREGGAQATKTLNDAVDVATQKGKTRATKADIGEAPVVKLTASGKLARIRELIEDAPATDVEDGIDLTFHDDDYKELLKLLGL